MKQHKISWLNIPGYIPATWNPIVGCNKTSPGCRECYAERMANRLAGMPLQSYKYAPVITDGKWNGKTFIDSFSIDKPSSWRKPHSIFVCSMGDLFHESLSFSDIDTVYEIMAYNPQHIFIVLTKRPERALEYFRWLGEKVKSIGFDSIPTRSENPLDYIGGPSHIWIGVTAENQEQADKRIPILLQIPSEIHFVSCEPLLGLLNLLKYLPVIAGHDKFNRDSQVDWVIVGGESGHNARAIHPYWVTSLKEQCNKSSTAFFFKQWGEWYTKWANIQNGEPVFKYYDSYLQFTQKYWVNKGDCCIDMNGKICKTGGDMVNAQYPVAIMQFVGRNKSGRLLEEREFNEFPINTL
jgi:protein gp37